MQAMTMYPYVDREIRRQAGVADRGRKGALVRAAHAAADAVAIREAHAAAEGVAIREAQPRDMPALIQLADLDSRPLPGGKIIVAESRGRIRAALSVDDGGLIADPFAATVSLQALLRLRADQIARERRTARRHGLLGVLHVRVRRAR